MSYRSSHLEWRNGQLRLYFPTHRGQKFIVIRDENEEGEENERSE